MRRHPEFRYDCGRWAIRGLPRDPDCWFDDLAEALDYAKAECAAEPTWIEMIVGDFHAIACQEAGWFRRLCCSNLQRSAPFATRHAERTTMVVEIR
jgi:hypothetical protein